MSNYAFMFLFVYDMFYSLRMLCNGVQVSHLWAFSAGRTHRACQVHICSEFVPSQWWQDASFSVTQTSYGHHTWGTSSGCKQVGDTVSYAVTVSSLQNLKDSFTLVAPNSHCSFTLSASVARTCSPAFWQDDKSATQLHNHLSLSASVRHWMFPLLMSLEYDLECCMSCIDFLENQNPQYSKSSNWSVRSHWHFIKHETTVVMITRHLLHWMLERTTASRPVVGPIQPPL
jgi:hypothetical protein